MVIISFLLGAWILAWFDFDQLFIKAFQELFNKDITNASYYFIFFCIGGLGDIVVFFRGDYENWLFF